MFLFGYCGISLLHVLIFIVIPNLIYQLKEGLGPLVNHVFLYILDNVRKLELQLRLCIPLCVF
jgi:hypothetical protein